MLLLLLVATTTTVTASQTFDGECVNGRKRMVVGGRVHLLLLAVVATAGAGAARQSLLVGAVIAGHVGEEWVTRHELAKVSEGGRCESKIEYILEPVI